MLKYFLFDSLQQTADFPHAETALWHGSALRPRGSAALFPHSCCWAPAPYHLLEPPFPAKFDVDNCCSLWATCACPWNARGECYRQAVPCWPGFRCSTERGKRFVPGRPEFKSQPCSLPAVWPQASYSNSLLCLCFWGWLSGLGKEMVSEHLCPARVAAPTRAALAEGFRWL